MSQNYSQSAINWHALKKIYLQGAKNACPPDPAPAPSNTRNAEVEFAKMEEYIKPIIEEIDQYYKGKLEELSNTAYIEIEGMRVRIVSLQAQLQRISEIKMATPKTDKEDEANSCSFKATDSRVLYRIENAQEQSLLDETSEKLFENEQLLQPRTAPKRKSMGKSSSNCRKLFAEGTVKESLKYQYSEGLYPLSTMRSSSVFDTSSKEMKEELFSLKKFIEQNHNINLEELSTEIQEVKASVKQIEVTGSRKEVEHLKNENEQLRNQNIRFKGDLINLQEELKQLRDLLCQALEETPQLSA